VSAKATSDTLVYEPRGAARDLWRCKAPEILIEGPAGTGKTRAVWEKVLALADKYPGSRHLVCRKTRKSMTDSVLVTFEEKVLPPGSPIRGNVKREGRHSYRLPNGSEIVVGGLDEPSRTFSAEYDTVTVFEAIEVTEDEWELLHRSLRNGRMPYTQAIADTNPGAPSHWLNQRANQGKMVRLRSRHEDNPEMYDAAAGRFTERGEQYIESRLAGLTGHRRARMYLGQWVAAEGLVFDEWDAAVHLVGADNLKAWGILNAAGGVGQAVRHVIGAVDWGYTNPGVIQVWAFDGDGRMYLLAETYHSRRLIDWWVTRAKAWRAAWGIEAFPCDPAEPAYIEAFRRAGLKAVAADNDIEAGVNAVKERLSPAGDGRPRLYVYDKALAEEDPELRAKKHPCGSVEEVENYTRVKKPDEPLPREEREDEFNHGMDCWRYAARHRRVKALVGSVVIGGGGRRF
jgi:phage terminase large subunit